MYSAVFQANKKKKLVKVKIVSILAAPLLKATYMKGILLLRVLAHTSCGNDRQTPLLLYRTLIIYKLKNGCKINSSSTEARLRVLDSVHHAGVCLATNAFRSSPIPSLLSFHRTWVVSPYCWSDGDLVCQSFAIDVHKCMCVTRVSLNLSVSGLHQLRWH